MRHLLVIICLSVVGNSCIASGGVTVANEIVGYKEITLKGYRTAMNDSISIVYFEDVIDNNSVSGYLPSELEVLDNMTNTEHQLPNNLSLDTPTFIINNHLYHTRDSIPDFKLLVPTYLASFRKGDVNYVVLNLMLFSAIGTTGYVCVVFQLDKNNSPVRDYVFNDRKPYRLKELKSIADKFK